MSHDQGDVTLKLQLPVLTYYFSFMNLNLLKNAESSQNFHFRPVQYDRKAKLSK